jgi:bile acid:Na+ symporter, BASS family
MIIPAAEYLCGCDHTHRMIFKSFKLSPHLVSCTVSFGWCLPCLPFQQVWLQLHPKPTLALYCISWAPTSGVPPALTTNMLAPLSTSMVLLLLNQIMVPSADAYVPAHVHVSPYRNGCQTKPCHMGRMPTMNPFGFTRINMLPSRPTTGKTGTITTTGRFLSESAQESKPISSSRLDSAMSRMTSCFPFWVLSFAIVGLLKPNALQWVNQGELISLMLSSVMVGTGLTLERKDFTDILTIPSNIFSVPLGVACQFLIMPFTANLLGRTILLASSGISSSTGSITVATAKALFLGLILVGCSPGGTASNLVSLIAQADVALSVILTACSTLLASAVTPFLVKFLVGSTVAVSGQALVAATARVVLLPVLLGMIIQARAPTLSQQVSRFTPFGSVLLIAFICGGVVAQNSALLLGSRTLLPRLLAAVGGLHLVGFALGYIIPRYVFQRGETTSRTISIETGMQNSALAVVLARSMGASPLASLPGALSATMHSCLGSVLAAYWLLRPTSADDTSEDSK